MHVHKPIGYFNTSPYEQIVDRPVVGNLRVLVVLVMARITPLSSVCTCEILKYPTCVCRLIPQVCPSTCARLAEVISKSKANTFMLHLTS